ncbi:MAG: hypothetical protein WKF78_03335 [Candidatus Limnocylindrales bacterium]
MATALIPFLEHDDANRALMGSNMQRQAVPLLRAGVADRRHRHGGARRARLGPGACSRRRAGDGPVASTAEQVIASPTTDAGELRPVHAAASSSRSNQGTCINQRPIVDVGHRASTSGQALADSQLHRSKGELALGAEHPRRAS